jgi:predicted RNase H-like nuclease
MFIQREHLDNANGSKREYNKARDRGNLRPEDLEAVYQRANEAYLANMEQIRQSDDNLKKTNHTEDERIQVMKDAGVSSKDILATLSGEYRPIPRIATSSTSEVYDNLPSGIAQKRKAIMEIRKTDRALAQRLMQNMKREQKDIRAGVNPRESLMKNLDVAERARMIMAHPNPTGYLREMQRKGIATKQVVDLVRLMQRGQ